VGLLTRSDDKFVESAVEDTRRRSAIANMTSQRHLLFVFALFLTFGPVLANIGLGPDFGVGGAVFVAIYWSIVLKVDSELRFLKVIDRLQKEGRLPPP
jgi:hypothetical protein